MFKIKRIDLFLVLILFCLFLMSACGPSPEELAATAIAETAAIATNIPTITLTPTPLPTPTETPTLTPTLTPIPPTPPDLHQIFPDICQRIRIKRMSVGISFHLMHPGRKQRSMWTLFR